MGPGPCSGVRPVWTFLHNTAIGDCLNGCDLLLFWFHTRGKLSPIDRFLYNILEPIDPVPSFCPVPVALWIWITMVNGHFLPRWSMGSQSNCGLSRECEHIIRTSVITVRNSSCGKVTFSQVSVILSTEGWGSDRLEGGGGSAWGGCLPRGVYPWGGVYPGGCTSLRGRHLPPDPEADPLPRDGHCRGRYVSYWDAFLLLLISGQEPSDRTKSARSKE